MYECAWAWGGYLVWIWIPSVIGVSYNDMQDMYILVKRAPIVFGKLHNTHTPKRWRWGLVQWQVFSTKSNKLWVWIWKSMSPKKLGARLSTNHQSRYYYYYYYCRFGTHGFIFHLTRLREGGSLTRAHWWWSKINFSFQRLKGLAFAKGY